MAIDVSFDDGKYRLVQDSGGTLRAYRHGERWAIADIPDPTNMMVALLYEIEELREKLKTANRRLGVIRCDAVERDGARCEKPKGHVDWHRNDSDGWLAWNYDENTPEILRSDEVGVASRWQAVLEELADEADDFAGEWEAISYMDGAVEAAKAYRVMALLIRERISQ
jgi:hypothetical protein